MNKSYKLSPYGEEVLKAFTGNDNKAQVLEAEQVIACTNIQLNRAVEINDGSLYPEHFTLYLPTSLFGDLGSDTLIKPPLNTIRWYLSMGDIGFRLSKECFEPKE